MRHHGFLMGGFPELGMANSLAGSGAHLQPNIPHTPQPSNELKTPTKVRNVFPETWLWTNESVGYIIG